jgi:branched-chain amino acid transport system substrate-binding protein
MWGRRARCLIAIVALGASGCAPEQPWRIGFVGGLSGRVSDIGRSGRDAAALAVEHVNARGGVAGRLVELIVRDDGQDTEQTKRAVGELIGAGVEVIVGPMTSAMAVAALPLADAADVTLVSPTVVSSRFSARDDNFVRVISSADQYAAAAARFAPVWGDKNGWDRRV